MADTSQLHKKSNTTMIRVFVNDRREGTFVCPACKYSMIKDLSEFLSIQTVIRVKYRCKCGHFVKALVERRGYFRKKVNFVGMFYSGSKVSIKKGLIRVLDVSQSGLQFTVNNDPLFKVGDRITVEFKLDDTEHSLIREEGIVRRIQENKIGMEFDTTDHYGKLGRYICFKN